MVFYYAGMEIMTLIADRYPKLLLNTLPKDPGAKHTQETPIHLAVAQRDAEGETSTNPGFTFAYKLIIISSLLPMILMDRLAESESPFLGYIIVIIRR